MSAEEEAVERGTRMLMAWFLHEDHELTCRDLVEELFAIARAQSPTERAIEASARAIAECEGRSYGASDSFGDEGYRNLARAALAAFLGEFENTQTPENTHETKGF